MSFPIDFEALRGFVAVAEQRSFVQAAERLAVSTSALTRRVQRLEDVIGVPLLVRNTRSVALSAAGERFLPNAHAVIDSLAAATRQVQDEERDRAMNLTLASLPTLTARLLPEIIRRFRERFPQIHVRVIEGSGEAVIERVREGTADFGFTFDPALSGDRGASVSGLVFQKVLDDPYCLIVPADHPLAAQDAVRWSELKPHAAIAAGTSSGNMRLLREGLRDVDWLSDTIYEVDHLSTSIGMVAAGLGVSVIPSCVAPEAQARGVLVRPLTEPAIHRTLGLVRRRGERLAESARQFLRSARAAAGAQSFAQAIAGGSGRARPTVTDG